MDQAVGPPQLIVGAQYRAVVDAFFAAAASGDLSALLALLAPDAELPGFTATAPPLYGEQPRSPPKPRPARGRAQSCVQ
jgi:ketosteroid isomerase-like protein